MDSREARKLYAEHANAIAYIDVETESGDRAIGSAFHIGEGVFVTARHVVENCRIIEIKITEPVGISSREFFLDVMKVEVSDDYIRNYDETLGTVMGHPPLFKHFLRPLEIVDGPHFAENAAFDVAVFRVREIHPAAGIVNGEWGTFFTFSYFYCEAGLSMIVVLHAKTVTIRYAGGAASYYCQGERKTKNL